MKSKYILENIPAELEKDHVVREYLDRLSSEKSKITMSSFIRRILSFFLSENKKFKWDDLNDALVSRFVTSQIKVASPATVNTMLICIKGISERLWISNRIDSKTWQLITKIKRVHGSRISRGRMLGTDEIKHLFEYCDRPRAGLRDVRDAAIFAVMCYCGLRRSEVAGLRYENVSLDENTPFIRLIGKGNKERVVPLPSEAVKRMKAWKEQRGNAAGFFFQAIENGEKICQHGLNPASIYMICKFTALRLGMKKWTPHDLRRTCASTLIEKGVDLTTVRDWLGHSSVTSTQLYDKRSQDRLSEVAKNFSY